MMEWIIVIPVIYLFLLLGLALEAHTMNKIQSTETEKRATEGFTVIINYRNESHNLPGLLESIQRLNYDFKIVQFIFINDHSTDNSAAIISRFQRENRPLQLLLLDRLPRSNSAKKDGITQAIHRATHNHIITTDADCVLPANWLNCFNAGYHQYPQAHFIAAPVFIASRTSLVSLIQSHEMVALQMITMGAFQIKRPFMCNGANMSFKKEVFLKVNGYAGNDHISSGDDIFLLEKLWQLDSEQCIYLKNNKATVTTFPKKTWRNMILQRARWAQKGTETSSLLNKLVSFQVFVMSLLFISLPFLYLGELISFNLLIISYIFKLLADFIVLFLGKQFFEHANWLRYFLLQFMIYPLAVLTVGVASVFKASWQDREINRPAA